MDFIKIHKSEDLECLCSVLAGAPRAGLDITLIIIIIIIIMYVIVLKNDLISFKYVFLWTLLKLTNLSGSLCGLPAVVSLHFGLNKMQTVRFQVSEATGKYQKRGKSFVVSYKASLRLVFYY